MTEPTPAPRTIETLGILGFGRLGTTLTKLATAAGYRVLVATASPPTTIARTATALHATATTIEAVIAEADAVVLALPLSRFRSLPAASFHGVLTIDAMNYWWGDGLAPDLDDPRTSTSETVQRFLHGARVVKALGHMGYQDLLDEARPPGSPERRALAIAGDDDADVDLVATVVDRLGFDPVIAGPLSAGVMLEPGGEAFGADVDATELREMFSRFPVSQRGIVIARARGSHGS